jgi:hypothetical protein
MDPLARHRVAGQFPRFSWLDQRNFKFKMCLYHEVILRLHFRHDDLQALPNVLFEFPNINPLRFLSIVHKLWPDSPGASIDGGQKILFFWISRYAATARTTFVDIIKSRTIVIIVVEELRVEGNSTPIGG